MSYFVLPPSGVGYIAHEWALQDGSACNGVSLSREKAKEAVGLALLHFVQQQQEAKEEDV